MPHSLVTGGAGFIGSHLVRGLLDVGHQVTVLDNLATGNKANLEEIRQDITFVEGDLRDRDLLAQLLPGTNLVFHQAALASVPRSVADPWTSHDVNVNGTLALLLAAREAGVKRVVYAASSSAYGNTATLPKIETMPATPRSPYAINKYTGELYCQVFAGVYGLETVSLRYFNVFGPRQDPASQYAAVIPKFLLSLLRGEPPVIYGDGEQTRDFTYVANVVAANLAAASAPAERVSGEVFNVGCGSRISLNRLAEELQQLIGVRISPRYEPTRTGDVRDSQASIEKAEAGLGYTPQVDLVTGLEKTIAWFRSQQPETPSQSAVPTAS